MQGAILKVKLRHLDAWTDARRRHAATYNQVLAPAGVQVPLELPYAKHVYHAYTIRTASRAELQERLLASGVQTGTHYPIPVHLQPAYSDLGYGPGDFPISERAAHEVLSLPVYPELTDDQINRVTSTILEWAGVGVCHDH